MKLYMDMIEERIEDIWSIDRDRELPGYLFIYTMLKRCKKSAEIRRILKDRIDTYESHIYGSEELNEYKDMLHLLDEYDRIVLKERKR